MVLRQFDALRLRLDFQIVAPRPAPHSSSALWLLGPSLLPLPLGSARSRRSRLLSYDLGPFPKHGLKKRRVTMIAW